MSTKKIFLRFNYGKYNYLISQDSIDSLNEKELNIDDIDIAFGKNLIYYQKKEIMLTNTGVKIFSSVIPVLYENNEDDEEIFCNILKEKFNSHGILKIQFFEKEVNFFIDPLLMKVPIKTGYKKDDKDTYCR